MNKMLLRLVAFAAPLFAAGSAFAQEAAEGGNNGLGSWAPALAISIAAFGGALGQARASAAALEGIARNPSASDKIFTPMILGLALIESLVIYALVVAIMLMG